MSDLALAIHCGQEYDSRFGGGRPPSALWLALNDYWRDRMDAESAELNDERTKYWLWRREQMKPCAGCEGRGWVEAGHVKAAS